MCMCACGTSSKSISYETTSFFGVQLEIPSTYTKTNDSELYKEFVSDKNSDFVGICYWENENYPELKAQIWGTLVKSAEQQKSIKDVSQSEYEIDSIKVYQVEYVENDYTSVMVLIPSEEGVISISTYIQNDKISEHVINSIKQIK